MSRLLRQLKTGRIYHHTAALAKRPDMVEYDPELAAKHLEAAKRRLEDLQNAPSDPIIAEGNLKESQELAEIEQEIDKLEKQKALPDNAKPDPKTEEEKAEAKKQEIIDQDPEINKILQMTTKSEVESYVLAEYGEDLDKRKDMDKLKVMAIELRIERLFEK